MKQTFIPSFAALLTLCANAQSLPAQTPKFFSFTGANGASPYSAPVQTTNGELYGITSGGGAYNYGAIYKITPAGDLTLVHSFGYTDGALPHASLVQGRNGNLYGTTSEGGTDAGTVFEMTLGGTLTTLYNFTFGDGSSSFAPLVQATNRNFYGTTNQGGAGGFGSIFEITASGAFTTLVSFDLANGAFPYMAGLTEGSTGDLYGTTTIGGATSGGTFLKMTLDGELITLYSFCSQVDCVDGNYPSGTIVQASDGDFYGMTEFGGTNDVGTIFRITPEGVVKTLHSFDYTDDGALPQAPSLSSPLPKSPPPAEQSRSSLRQGLTLKSNLPFLIPGV